MLKLVAIFLVIWGHAIQYFQNGVASSDGIYRFIYSFHMPLFMMLAGFFATDSMNLCIKDFIKKKAHRLLLPAIVCGSLVWIVCQFVTQEEISVKDRICDFIWMLLTDFWFLKTCFLCYLLLYLSHKVKGTFGLWLTLLLSQLKNILFLSIMYPCFMVGAILQKNQKFRWLAMKYWLVFLIIFLMMSAIWDNSYFLHPQNQDFSLFLVAKRLFTVLIGLTGSLSLIGLALSLSDKVERCESKLCDSLSEYGSFTLGIYILQSIIVEHLMASWFILNSLSFFTFHFIVTPLISLIVMIVSIAIIRVIRKSKWASSVLIGE